MRLTRFLSVRFSDLGELTKKYANLPETYLKRRMEVIEYKTPRGFPQYRARTLKRKDYNFEEHRPWTEEFRTDNEIGRTHKKLWVEPIKDWKIFKGDLVEILVGKDKGKQGKVIQVIQERNWIFVEGLNCKLELYGESKTSPGVYMQREKPLLVTNEVALVDPNDMKPVDIEWRYTEEGVRVRVSLRSERIIPLPVEVRETLDYKEKHLYIESPKDTRNDEVQKVTFQPALETFEMAIAREHGIEDERVPARTFCITDMAEHKFFDCGRWHGRRFSLFSEIGVIVTSDNIVGAMLQGEGTWNCVKQFAEGLLRAKKLPKDRP